MYCSDLKNCRSLLVDVVQNLQSSIIIPQYHQKTVGENFSILAGAKQRGAHTAQSQFNANNLLPPTPRDSKLI